MSTTTEQIDEHQAEQRKRRDRLRRRAAESLWHVILVGPNHSGTPDTAEHYVVAGDELEALAEAREQEALKSSFGARCLGLTRLERLGSVVLPDRLVPDA
jgi:hypothetical protein